MLLLVSRDTETPAHGVSDSATPEELLAFKLSHHFAICAHFLSLRAKSNRRGGNNTQCLRGIQSTLRLTSAASGSRLRSSAGRGTRYDTYQTTQSTPNTADNVTTTPPKLRRQNGTTGLAGWTPSPMDPSGKSTRLLRRSTQLQMRQQSQPSPTRNTQLDHDSTPTKTKVKLSSPLFSPPSKPTTSHCWTWFTQRRLSDSPTSPATRFSKQSRD